MKRFRSLALGIVVLLAVTAARSDAPPQHPPLQPPSVPIPDSLFGMHIHRAASTTPWPASAFGTWRLWDAYVAWPNLEPKRGEWNFEILDKDVSLAEKEGVEILLTLGLSPGWASARPDERSNYAPGNAAEPKSLDDWRHYVHEVAARYKGRITNYEVWNEPNLKGSFSGTPEEMITLARVAHEVLKEVDPSITLVSPSPTGADGVGWLDQFLQKSGGAYVDVIGYHFYVSPQPPETIVDLVARVRDVLASHGLRNTPLWDTETGWRIEDHKTEVTPAPGVWSKVLSDKEASAYVVRSYILLWAAGVSRFYWYAWDNRLMGLTEADGTTLKAPARAYAEAERWLIGSRMTSCGPDAQGTWVSEIARQGGYRAWIVWNPQRTTKFQVPATWRAREGRDLAGSVRVISDTLTTQVDQVPVMFERPGEEESTSD